VFYLDIFFLSSRRGGKKTTEKKKYAKKGRELTFKLLFCPFTSGSRFCLLSFALLFQAFSLSIFFFSSKKKTTQKKKPIEKKKNANKGRSLLSNFCFALSFLAPTFALSFQVLSPNIFFFSNKRKKKHNEKKNHREKKNAEKGGNLPLFKQKKRKKNIKKGGSSPLVKQKDKKKKNHKEKKIIEKKKKCKEGNLFSLLHLG
jgi:hypothetical protein